MNNSSGSRTLSYYNPPKVKHEHQVINSDICIYGATSAGIVAAVQAVISRKKVVVIDMGYHIGGMTTSGLSATDIGNKHVIGGLSRKFYQECGKYYGESESWLFEPKISKKVFLDWIDRYKIPIYQGCPLIGSEKYLSRILSIDTEDGSTFKAKIFIDATYEGDMMARSGVNLQVEENPTASMMNFSMEYTGEAFITISSDLLILSINRVIAAVVFYLA